MIKCQGRKTAVQLLATTGYGAVWLARTSGGREAAGSNPVSPTSITSYCGAYMGEAQLAEQQSPKLSVAGSNPVAHARYDRYLNRKSCKP